MVEHRWLLLLIGWALAAGLLALLYLRQRRTNDATIVDAGWSASLVLLAILYAVLAPGDLAHRLLIAGVGGLEYARIGVLVVRRVGKGEDTRYRELRARWRARGREQTTFAIFFQAQAFLAAVLSVPFLLASFNGHDGLEPLEWVGAGVWLVSAPLEALADRQLARFKSDPANRGRTMDEGLWRYSRHPNYFFQWIAWVAYALIALAAPWGWLALFAPPLMLLLILFVTGVRPAEEQALRSRGDDYRAYQRRTSAFVPLPPGEDA